MSSWCHLIHMAQIDNPSAWILSHLYISSTRTHLFMFYAVIGDPLIYKIKCDRYWWLRLWYLKPLSRIFQLFRGWPFYWMEETRIPAENNQPAASHGKTLSHNVVSSAHKRYLVKATKTKQYSRTIWFYFQWNEDRTVKLFLGDFNILCMKNDKFVLHKEYSNILNGCSSKANRMSIEVEISEHFIAFCTRKTTKEHAGK
jgi:hypothetical protein